jgi:hypothetical protein
MWACRAASGSVGRSRSAVCVDRIMVPLGNLTGIPFVVGILLMQWLSIRRKCPVHPESA